MAYGLAPRIHWRVLIAGVLLLAVFGVVLYPVCTSPDALMPHACLSNVKQLDLALLLYSSDHDDRMPVADVWYDSIGPHTTSSGGPRIDFRCPDVPETFNGAPSVGYAFNEQLSLRAPGRADDPQSTIAVYDSANLLKNATDAVTSLPFHGRHKGGNNFGYWDGHVKFHLWTENPGLVRPK